MPPCTTGIRIPRSRVNLVSKGILEMAAQLDSFGELSVKEGDNKEMDGYPKAKQELARDVSKGSPTAVA